MRHRACHRLLHAGVRIAALSLISSPAWSQSRAVERAPVGFRVTYVMDRSRAWRPAATASDAGRPLRVSVWYPAARSDSRAMTLATYAHAGSGRRAGATLDSLFAPRESVTVAVGWARGNAAAFRALWTAPSFLAHMNAAPAPGSHPVVVYVPGADALRPIDNLVLLERLASRGFVVVTVPRLGRRLAGQTMLGASDEDSETLARDAEVAMGWSLGLPHVDATRIAVLGVGEGADAAARIVARNPVVRAVALMDDAWFCPRQRSRRDPVPPPPDPHDMRASTMALCSAVRDGADSAARGDMMRWSERELIDLPPGSGRLSDQTPLVRAAGSDSAAHRIGQQYAAIGDEIVRFYGQTLRSSVGLTMPLASAQAVLGRVRLMPAIRSASEWDLAELVSRAGPDSAISRLRLDRARNADVALLRPRTLSRIQRDRLAGGNVKEGIALGLVLVAAFPDLVSSYDALADAYRAAADSTGVVSSYSSLLGAVARDSTLSDSARADWREYVRTRVAEFTRGAVEPRPRQ